MEATLERRMKGHKVWYLIWITNKTSSLQLCCYSPLFTDHSVCTANGGWQFSHKTKEYLFGPMGKNSFLIVCRNIHQKFVLKTLFISLQQLGTTRWRNLWLFRLFFIVTVAYTKYIQRRKRKKTFSGSSYFKDFSLDISFHAPRILSQIAK